MPSVLILLAVYNEEAYLKEQIQSLADQTFENVHILASDDGSTDSSMKILEAAQRKWIKGEFRIIQGPQQGYAKNFQKLILNSEIDADYFAFCDQGHVWDNDKLERAIVLIDDQYTAHPAAYAGKTRLIDEIGDHLGYSELFNKPNLRQLPRLRPYSLNSAVDARVCQQVLVFG